MIYHFHYWKEWLDTKGQLWAEPYNYTTPTEARKAHLGALTFNWATNLKHPSVTDLYSVAYEEDPATGKLRTGNRTTIQQGGIRGHVNQPLDKP